MDKEKLITDILETYPHIWKAIYEHITVIGSISRKEIEEITSSTIHKILKQKGLTND